jgi:hypothetical protein
MRGRRRTAALRAILDIQGVGCSAAGYRLAGAGLDQLCCRHLYGNDRLVTAWPMRESAVVIVVGPHDQSAVDVYDQLLAALGSEIPSVERNKPSCCDELGFPPINELEAARIADAVEQASRRRRRS